MKNCLKRVVAKNEHLYKMSRSAYNFYQNLQEERKARSEFNPRMQYSRSIAKNFIDVSSKPELNVIIIAIDCLRYRNMSFAGYDRKTTPFLDSFRAKFKAISAAPYTYPSVPSILTGLYPHNHGAYIYGKVKNFDILENFQLLRKNILTLPELLFVLNYDIYFSTSIAVAKYPMKGRVIPKLYIPETPAQKLLKDARKWISKREKPFFAYIHLGDIHQPLSPPSDFRNFFGAVKNLPNIDMWDFRRIEEQKGKEFQEYKENRILLYDNTLRYVDYAIEQFYFHLKDQGLIDSTIFIFTADHGEEFWEHAKPEAENFYDPRGYYGVGHGHNVFNEIIEVPIIVDRGISKKVRVKEELWSSTDIMPSIIDALGIKHDLEFDGISLFKTQNNRDFIFNESIGYGHEKKALITNGYKLIYSKDDNVQWVFDLKKDPEERYPILDEDITSLLLSKLRKIFTENEKLNIKEMVKNKLRGSRENQK